MLSTLFSYLSPSIHADAEASTDEGKYDEKKNEKSQESESQEDDDSEKKDDDSEKKDDDAEEEEEEEDEPEDLQPELREACQSTVKCAPLKSHFEHCQEKIHEQRGFKGEDCVEEMFHLMHCADECAGPKLFHKLH